MRRCLIAAALLAVAPAHAQPGLGEPERCAAGGPAYQVQLVGLRDRRGNFRIELYPANQEDWLADRGKLRAEGKFFHRVIVPVPASGPTVICIGVPAPGRYALIAIHDRDGKRSFNAFVDGVGFPGDPRLSLSKPKVEKAVAAIGAGVQPLRIRLQYISGLSVGPVRRPVDEAQYGNGRE